VRFLNCANILSCKIVIFLRFYARHSSIFGLHFGLLFRPIAFRRVKHFSRRQFFESFKQDLFGRLQHSDEFFPAYVSTIMAVCGRKIRDNLFGGFSSSQRSCLMFQMDRYRPPVSAWSQHEDSVCCAVTPSHQLWKRDTGHQGDQLSDAGPEGCTYLGPFNVVCFRCKNPGHVLCSSELLLSCKDLRYRFP
jgi:hypothetical protein